MFLSILFHFSEAVFCAFCCRVQTAEDRGAYLFLRDKAGVKQRRMFGRSIFSCVSVISVIHFFTGSPGMEALRFFASCELMLIGDADIRTFRIPDRLTAAFFFTALFMSFSSGEGLLFMTGGFLFTGLPLVMLRCVFGKAAIGGGDVKLAAAAGVLLGPERGMYALLISCLTAIVFHVFDPMKKETRRIAMGPFLGFGIFSLMLFPG